MDMMHFCCNFKTRNVIRMNFTIVVTIYHNHIQQGTPVQDAFPVNVSLFYKAKEAPRL